MRKLLSWYRKHGPSKSWMAFYWQEAFILILVTILQIGYFWVTFSLQDDPRPVPLTYRAIEIFCAICILLFTTAPRYSLLVRLMHAIMMLREIFFLDILMLLGALWYMFAIVPYIPSRQHPLVTYLANRPGVTLSLVIGALPMGVVPTIVYEEVGWWTGIGSYSLVLFFFVLYISALWVEEESTQKRYLFWVLSNIFLFPLLYVLSSGTSVIYMLIGMSLVRQ